MSSARLRSATALCANKDVVYKDTRPHAHARTSVQQRARQAPMYRDPPQQKPAPNAGARLGTASKQATRSRGFFFSSNLSSVKPGCVPLAAAWAPPRSTCYLRVAPPREYPFFHVGTASTCTLGKGDDSVWSLAQQRSRRVKVNQATELRGLPGTASGRPSTSHRRCVPAGSSSLRPQLSRAIRTASLDNAWSLLLHSPHWGRPRHLARSFQCKNATGAEGV